MIKLQTSQELAQIFDQNSLVLLYFSTPQCSVCHAIKPKIEQLVRDYPYPLIDIDASKFIDLSGQYLIFSSPSLVIFEHHKELLRESRFIDLNRIERFLTLYHSS